MTCDHPRFHVSADVHRIVKEGDAEAVGFDKAPVAVYALEVTCACAECGQPFQFDWTKVADPDVVPLGTDFMKKRPWVSPFRDTLGASISPMSQENTVVHTAATSGTKH